MNDNLVIALESLSDEMIIDRIPDVPDHIFSRKFEKRMKRIISGTYSPKIHITQKRMTVKKLTVCLVAALLAIFTLAMSVSAVRETILKIITQVFATYTVVKSEDDDVYPETFEEIYEITEGVANYEVIETYETPAERVTIYDNGQRKIRFTQAIKKYYDVNINSEGYEMVTVNIGGNDGFYVDMTKQSAEYLFFDKGRYIITITVSNYESEYSIGKNALISLANSVQIVEK
jgi:hypothetical protein